MKTKIATRPVRKKVATQLDRIEEVLGVYCAAFNKNARELQNYMDNSARIIGGINSKLTTLKAYEGMLDAMEGANEQEAPKPIPFGTRVESNGVEGIYVEHLADREKCKHKLILKGIPHAYFTYHERNEFTIKP